MQTLAYSLNRKYPLVDAEVIWNFLDDLSEIKDTRFVLEALWGCLERIGGLGFSYFSISGREYTYKFGNALDKTDDIYNRLFGFYSTQELGNQLLIDEEETGYSVIITPTYGPYFRDAVFIIHMSQPTHYLPHNDLKLIEMVLQKAHVTIARCEASIKGTSLNLSKREVDVLACLSQGHSNKQIAVLLDISSHTVNGYIRRIMLKMGVNDRLNACLQGLLLPEVRGKILRPGLSLLKTHQ